MQLMRWGLVQPHHKPQEQWRNNNKIKDSGEGMNCNIYHQLRRQKRKIVIKKKGMIDEDS